MISVNGMANGWCASRGRSVADQIEIRRSKMVSNWRYERDQEAHAREVFLHRMLFQMPVLLSRT